MEAALLGTWQIWLSLAIQAHKNETYGSGRRAQGCAGSSIGVPESCGALRPHGKHHCWGADHSAIPRKHLELRQAEEVCYAFLIDARS